MSQESYDDLLAKLHRNFGDLIPNGIDDIIRQNRHELQLELASSADMMDLQMPFIISNLKGNLECGFIYKRVFPTHRMFTYFLIGRRIGKPASSAVHTSPVIGYDRENQAVFTQSGSHYLIQEFIEPDPFLLVNLCGYLTSEGVGSYFGVPRVYLK
jgi:hypothetical protein